MKSLISTLQRFSGVVGVLVLAACLPEQARGQEVQTFRSAQPAAAKPQVEPQMLEIYRIDLEPTGSAFALGKPTLEGESYVFTAWPERATARLPRAKVKKITLRTKDLSKETVYQIDLIPSGRMIAREKPTLQGKSYVFHAFKNGTLMSVRRTDVQKITLLTGLPAFRVQQEELGAALTGDLPMEGGSGPVRSGPGAAAAPGKTSAPGNWTYEGKPGATDAYGPANATVASPGDVPKAPPPPPPPPPH
jgi:hypothetical protein